jgi:hypothetical protein
MQRNVPKKTSTPVMLLRDSFEAKDFTTNNLEWVLPGVHVEYEVVRKFEVESSRVHTNEGQVRIETETGYLQRQKEIKELTKPKL